ncbi:hypothetical protein ACRRTK_012013 [Alexandromys fortis]
MDVRCHSDTEAARVSKTAHKESREIKGAEGSLPAAFLKEPQGAFSASGASEDCNKSKSNSSADPDYCRRILVRAALRGPASPATERNPDAARSGQATKLGFGPQSSGGRERVLRDKDLPRPPRRPAELGRGAADAAFLLDSASHKERRALLPGSSGARPPSAGAAPASRQPSKIARPRKRVFGPSSCCRLDAKGSIREIILPKGLDLDRPKRTRTSFTAEQLYRLEMEFQRCQYVVGRERTELARQLNLSETQVKVWFQNRRTKQKKDQGKDSELRSVVSETAATCSVLRLLEQGRLLSPPGLPALLPPCATSALGSALRGPSLPALSAGAAAGSAAAAATAPGPAGAASQHPPAVGGAPGPGPAGPGGLHAGAPAASHGLFSLPVPSLLGSVASRLSSAPLTMAGSLAGNLQELSARYLSSSAFEPYSRTNNKEGAEKKALD